EDSSPAFRRVCGNEVLRRLVLGAYRHGASAIQVAGSHLERAREVLRDPRLEDAVIVYDELPASEEPVVEVTADVVVGHPVWAAIAGAEGPRFVPGAPHFRHAHCGDAEALWDTPPRGAFVVPVQDRAGARRAKRAIFANITKATSGPVSRHLNAKFSIPLSKLLVETPMTPNQMTLTNTLIGIAGSLCYATGTLAGVAIGGLVLQLASALDRNDGELARSKMMESHKGAWYDSVGDNITYLVLTICIVLGYARFVAVTPSIPWAPFTLPIGGALIVLSFTVIGGMFLWVHRRGLGGTMTAIASDFRDNVTTEKRGWVFAFLDKVKVLGERDQFSLLLMVVSLMPWLTGDARWYHALFFSVVGFVFLANIYFGLGALKTLRAAR
ncbi:MAG: CDP-alcohol phosphatidyltransferase family protein, partial [Myxococcota bacterium]